MACSDRYERGRYTLMQLAFHVVDYGAWEEVVDGVTEETFLEELTDATNDAYRDLTGAQEAYALDDTPWYGVVGALEAALAAVVGAVPGAALASISIEEVGGYIAFRGHWQGDEVLVYAEWRTSDREGIRHVSCVDPWEDVVLYRAVREHGTRA
jgi:hypothetical protein